MTGRLLSTADAGARRVVGRRAVDRRHREDVAGLHVDDDRGAALRTRRRDPGHERLLGVPLERLVDREHEVAAPLRRQHLAFPAGDVVALRVAFHLHRPGNAGQQVLFVAVLEPAETGVVGADEADDRPGERGGRVEALGLGRVREAREVQGLDLRDGRVVDLAGDVRERAGLRRQARQQRLLVDGGWTIKAPSFAAADGSLMTRGSATIVVCGTETASTLPLRSKMLPRSAGTATVRTRCPTPSDVRCERSRAWRSNRRTPMAANASTITSRIVTRRSRTGGSGRAGRVGCSCAGAGRARGRGGAKRCVLESGGSDTVGRRTGRRAGAPGGVRARQGCSAPRPAFTFDQSLECRRRGARVTRGAGGVGDRRYWSRPPVRGRPARGAPPAR